jgi:ABC-type molybdate transport system ATPase subunit
MVEKIRVAVESRTDPDFLIIARTDARTTLGLDEALRDRLGAYLRRVRETFGVPMIQVTHAADEVVSLSDDVVVMASGQVTRRGTPAELFVPTGEPQYRLGP